MSIRATDSLTVAIVQGTAEIAGAERQLLAAVAGLVDGSVHPRVLLFGDGPLAPQLRQAGAEVACLGELPRARQPRRWRGVVGRVVGAAAGADVLHAQGEKLVPAVALAGRRAGIPVVRHLHDRPGRSVAALALHGAGRLVPCRGATVVPSQSMLEQVRRLGGQATVIPNGIDPATLPDRVSATATRQALGVPDGAVLVVLPGRLQRWKGQAEAIRALAKARERAPSLHLVLLGDALFGLEPEFPGELRRLAQELGVAHAVTFAGHRDDALEVIAAADLVLHASLTPEPFGMVVLEGMALARAVIASASGGPAELIADGQTGVLIRPGDVAAMAATLVDLAAAPERRDQLGAAARESVIQTYSAQAVGAAWAACYRAVLDPA
ncbi:MAG: glycosyltransferase family 4 protein [Solirubrobacteraceae bacterium]|nr:glycosyltransferase family 4 protein [Solirubrobacteraceae bacterium]